MRFLGKINLILLCGLQRNIHFLLMIAQNNPRKIISMYSPSQKCISVYNLAIYDTSNLKK